MNPEKDGKTEALVESADPLVSTIEEIAQESGLTSKQARTVVERMRTKGLLLSRALGEVTRSELRDLFEYQAHRVLAAITPQDVEKASLYQKMTSAAIAVDKAQLLAGQPTEILSVQQQGNLDELCGVLLKEARRRGLEPQENEATLETAFREMGPGHGQRWDPSAKWKDPADEPESGVR